MRTFIFLAVLSLVACKKHPPITYSTPEPEPERPVTTATPEPEPEPAPRAASSPYPSAAYHELELSEFDLQFEPGGDIDGDGRADFLIGAPRAREAGVAQRSKMEPGTPPDMPGKAWVVLGYQFAGQPSGSSFTLNRTFVGEHTGDGFGTGIAGVGDVDGDGLSDFLVGAPAYDDGGEWRGAVYLFTGAALKENPNASREDAWTILYGERNDAVGGNLRGVGDLDGDGLGDALIPGRLSSYVSLGRTTANFETFYLREADNILTGALEGEAFNPRAMSMGDLLGDSVDEMLISTPDFGGTGTAWLVTGRSLYGTRILDMSDAHAKFVAPGTQIGAHLAAADLDGDGRKEAVLSWVGDQTTLSAVDAGHLVSPGQIDLAAQAMVQLVGESGWSIVDVTSPGDVDGDGLGDLVVGTRMEGAALTARTYLLTAQTLRSGTVLSLDQADAVFEFEVDRDFSWATKVIPAGDINADGKGDLVIVLQGWSWDDPPRVTPARVQVHLSPYRL
jgi:hypothetical protein